MSVIDEVKQRTDIVEVVSQYTTLSKAGRIFKGLCPFHSEKHPSFFVYPEQQSWHCFGACNTGGDVFSFIMKQQDTGFGEALRLLAERAGVTLPSRGEQGAEKEKNERLYQTNEAAASYFHRLLLESPAAEKSRSYITKRGLSKKSVAEFQLGHSLNSWDSLKKHLMERGYSNSELIEAGLVIETESGDSHDRFRNKLIFPIPNDKGRICGFGARVLDDSLPKYVNSPETPIFNKSGILYGLNLAKQAIKKQEQVVIVEGYLDVITAHQNGFGNVVASMGIAVTEKHINLLKRLTKNVVFALDADAAGEEAMLRCVGYENAIDNEVRVLILPQGKDPDDVIKEDKTKWQKLLEEAMPIVDFTFGMVTAELDLTKASDKPLAEERLIPVIDYIKDDTRQYHYIEKLAKLIGSTPQKVESDLEAYRARQKIAKPAVSIEPKKQYSVTEKPKPTSVALPAVSSPLEEYCLALLLQQPELKSYHNHMLPDYFENSENRETFIALKETKEAASVRDRLDSAIWEHFDHLINKELPSNNIEQKLVDCISRLKERYLRSLEMKKGAILSAEENPSDQISKLKEQGTDNVAQLGEVFRQRSTIGHKRGSTDGTR